MNESGAIGGGMHATKKPYDLKGYHDVIVKSASPGYGTDNGNESGNGGAKPNGSAPDTHVCTPSGKPLA